MATTQDVLQSEFMSLAPGVGIIPEKFRNRAYEKLDFGPGEGGIGALLESRSGGGDSLTKADFIAGIREVVAGLGGAPKNKPGRPSGLKQED